MKYSISGLKKCPFCGSHLLSITLKQPAWGSDKPEQTVICDDCAASAPVYVWNDRSTEKAEVMKALEREQTLRVIN